MKHILGLIDKKLAEVGNKLLRIKKYDLAQSVDIDEMYLLVMYRKILLNKLMYCADCFDTFDKNEISSKILRIIYS